MTTEKHITGIIRRPAIITPPPVVPSNIVTLRRWGDPILYALDGMSTAPPPAGIGIGNFQELPLFHLNTDSPTTGAFGAISSFQKLGRAELDYLQSIQPNDYAKYGYTVKQKMGWLIGAKTATAPPGTIYWTKTLAWDDPLCSEIYFGTLGFGGQKMAVELDGSGNKKQYVFWGKYRVKTTSEWIPFYKVIGFRRADVGRPVGELLAEGKVQICTSANRGGGLEDVYTETLKGIVYHPVWSPYDYPSNYGNALYIAKEFCL